MGRSTHWSHLISIQSLALLGGIKAPYGHLHQSIRLGIRYKDSVRAKKYWLRSVCVKSTLSALTYLDRQRPGGVSAGRFVAGEGRSAAPRRRILPTRPSPMAKPPSGRSPRAGREDRNAIKNREVWTSQELEPSFILAIRICRAD
jgi:hypothetical protein